MDADSDVGVPVELYVYDLTKGMAAMMSQMLIGRQVEGIWHTAIVAYGREFYFGSAGVQRCSPGCTVLGEPDQIVKLGETYIPYQVFFEYVLGLGESTFRPESYDLFLHNCNNFTNEVSQFLCGKGIPKQILDLPHEILDTPLGQTLRPLIDSLNNGARGVAFGLNAYNGLQNYQPQQSLRQREDSPDFLELNSAIEEARRNSIALEERRNEINEKLAKKDRKKKKKKKKKHQRENQQESEGSSSAELTLTSSAGSSTELTPASSPGSSRPPSGSRQTKMADEVIELSPPEEQQAPEPAQQKTAEEVEAEIEAAEKKEREEKKKQREPPVIFKDAVDVRVEFDAFVGLVDGILSPEEQQSLEELHQYMLEDEGSWALGDGFLNFVGRLLHDKSLKPEIRVRLLNVLAAAALKDDVILLLHQDRREHVLMNYAHDVDRLTLDEQKSLALFMCNMFENLSSSEWMLYISEWQYCNATISNIRVTTKVAVHCLLSEQPELQDRGSAIIHNLACKEVKTVVFDDVAVELTMALLQFFNGSPPEEHLFRCMKALARFCQISPQDVPQLIQMIGPEPAKFRGVSQRVDELITQISSKMR
ncbi:uncharacterized protein [Anabrus simplex]|uniref:uncharacterized protein isoform X2 n=1 Tax=Anabrus simplex TaxID=316456 RepID=UPI0035A384AA